MESPQINLKDDDATRSGSTTSSNQLFMAESFDLPDDTFRMSLDYISEIGENVTIGERDPSIDNVTNNMVTEPQTPCNTPLEVEKAPTKTPTKALLINTDKVEETNLCIDNVTDKMVTESHAPYNTPLECDITLTPTKKTAPKKLLPVNIDTEEADISTEDNMVTKTQPPCNTPIIEGDKTLTPTHIRTSIKLTSSAISIDTPKRTDDTKGSATKPHNLLKLSLSKNIDDGFVKPSPIAEVMSPAKMLQFEVDISNSATPTMKRAAIDFNFFNQNNFEEYFVDVPSPQGHEIIEEKDAKVFKETPVIVKANTVRHEIGYENGLALDDNHAYRLGWNLEHACLEDAYSLLLGRYFGRRTHSIPHLRSSYKETLSKNVLCELDVEHLWMPTPSVSNFSSLYGSTVKDD